MKDPSYMNSGIKGQLQEGVLREAVYGLSEWKRSEIQKANLIANPDVLLQPHY